MAQSAAAAKPVREPKRDLLGPSVGKRIKAIRNKRGMSLAQVGGSELSRSFLSLVESGRSRISLRALAIVAEHLETPIVHFLEDEDTQRVAELGLDYAEIELERGNPLDCVKALEAHSSAYKSEPRAQWLRGRAYMDLDEPAKATKVLREAAELSHMEVDSNLTAEIAYSLGRSLYVSDNYEEAGACFREGLQVLLEGGDNPGLQARLNMAIGHILYVQNRPDEAISHYDRARELFGSLYDLSNVGSVFSAMSLAAKEKGDLEVALRYSKQSVAAFRLKRDWKLVARELNNMAMRYLERGEFETARERAEEAVQRAHDAGAVDLEASGRGTLASVCLQQGRLEDAEKEARASEALAPETAPLARVDAWLVLGQIAAQRGKPVQADDYYKRSLDSLRKLRHRTRFADTALSYSLLLKERGDTDAALDVALEAAQAQHVPLA